MNWRDFGSPDASTWRQIVTAAGGPPELASTAAWASSGEHGWLALAMLKAESSFATDFNLNKRENNNPLNLRPAAGGGYMAFDSLAEGIAEWRTRLTSETYKDGIYARTTDLPSLIHVYAPSSDDNNESEYVETIKTLFARWGVSGTSGPVIPSEGGSPVPFTPVIYDLWKDYARFGLTKAEADRVIAMCFWNRRDGSIQGRPTHRLCHIQAGTTVSSLDWWANGYVVRNGVRTKVQASSTVMIQRDGSILRVIPEEHGPWTNGDDYAPKPTGQALVNQPGNSNIWTLSIEAEGMTGAEVLQYPIQMDAIEWQLRKWAVDYPETAPMVNLLEHADVQRINKPNCAGAYYPVMRQRLAADPVPTPEPAYPDPLPWPYERGEVGIENVGDAKARLITCEVTCTKPNGTIPRQSASSTAKQSGEKIAHKQRVVAIAHISVTNAKGRRENWLAIEDPSDPAKVHRVGQGAFEPRLPAA